MMSIPGYDEWKLRGPEEDLEDEEIEDPDDYGDYLYERFRDEMMEKEYEERA